MHKLGQKFTACEAVSQLAHGKLTATELLEHYLSNIDQHDQSILALGDTDVDGARQQASLVDEKSAQGLLSGIPFGIKDIIDVKSLRTTCDSSIYSDYIPNKDATCVALIKAAGGVILGKTRTTEFAYARPTETRNPINVEYSPGGSSSGSAAGVAAGFFPMALGTQTGGSTIRPGSYCGVYAFKPTYDLIDRQGVKTLAASLDTIGWYANSISDLKLLFSVLALQTNQQKPKRRKPRVALCRTPYWHQADQEMRSLVENISRKLNAEEIVLPDNFRQAYKDHACIMAVEASRSLSVEYKMYRDQLSDTLLNLIERGQKIDSEEECAARVRLAERRNDLDGFLEDFDVFITPPAPGAAPKTLASTGDSIFNRLWTALHVPCMAIPVDYNDHGMPLGIQLVARRYHDELFFDYAADIESDICTTPQR